MFPTFSSLKFLSHSIVAFRLASNLFAMDTTSTDTFRQRQKSIKEWLSQSALAIITAQAQNNDKHSNWYRNQTGNTERATNESFKPVANREERDWKAVAEMYVETRQARNANWTERH